MMPKRSTPTSGPRGLHLSARAGAAPEGPANQLVIDQAGRDARLSRGSSGRSSLPLSRLHQTLRHPGGLLEITSGARGSALQDHHDLALDVTSGHLGRDLAQRSAQDLLME